MNARTTRPVDDVPRLSRRGMMVACCTALATAAGANDRPQAVFADRVLIEWGVAPTGSSSHRTRLKVFGSGLVESWPADRSPAQREQRTPEEARRLVDQLAELLRSSDVSSESIQRELRDQSRRTGLSFAISHADDSVVRLATETGLVQVRCPAPPLLAERFPEASRLQTFARVEQRLCNLGCVVHCGGRHAAETVCAKANERLQAEHPGAAEWTIEDLMMVRLSPDGGRFVQFRREDAAAEFWTTCVTESPGRAARVTVIPPASLLR